MNILQSILLAIIEGITEFLPISSTGHMIIASSVMGIAQDDFVKLFTICIQLGAILSVFCLYFKRFFKSFQFYFKLIVAFIPAAIFGILLNDFIDGLLENPLVVAITLLLGGVLLLFVDKWFKQASVDDSDEITYLTALKIGFFQCLAMIPGVSRSGASIVGGMTQQLTRKAAAEFSFFLALPTMLGATVKKMIDFFHHGRQLPAEQIKLLLVGNVVAFLVAMLAIKTFISLLNWYGFKPFGWYRIMLGGSILLLYVFGIELKML